MNNKIKINFVDFWGDFNKCDNFITRALSKKYEVAISDNPDYLFFGTFGYRHLNYNCVKIMFIGENIAPDFNLCDYALGFDFIQFGDRYMRLPLYCTYESFASLAQTRLPSDEALIDRKFCSMVVSNNRHASPHRERFFKLLSEYKQVDSGGRLWNNVGGPVANKLEFVSQYKFNIAFENSAVHGYTTEKIMEPMAVNTLPLYWGNPLVCKDFNAASFVNVNDFASMEDAVQHIVDLDNDDSKYLQMIKAPKVLDENIINWEERLLDFLSNIIEKPIEEARYLAPFGVQKLYREELLAYDILSRRLKVKKIVAAYDKLRKKIRG
ncbi:MAG: glycosyltransferase [Bacteroidaceae bacterium]|nr:glycosyltransferase [Bacteroidaceae bacterium]